MSELKQVRVKIGIKKKISHEATDLEIFDYELVERMWDSYYREKLNPEIKGKSPLTPSGILHKIDPTLAAEKLRRYLDGGSRDIGILKHLLQILSLEESGGVSIPKGDPHPKTPQKPGPQVDPEGSRRRAAENLKKNQQGHEKAGGNPA